MPQQLLRQDRSEYERILDEVLRSAPRRPELAAVGVRLGTEQLRTMALNATAVITAAAASEYQHYVRVREERHRPIPSYPGASAREAGSSEPGEAAMGLATSLGEVTEREGAGVAAVVAVLTPVLAGTAAVIFLLVGYVTRALDSQTAFARTMLTVGWLLSGLTAASILVAAVGLLLTAVRHKQPQTIPDGDGEVARARDAWHEALVQRGILPFLHQALAADPKAVLRTTSPPAPAGRMPPLDQGRPGLLPDDGPVAGPRPGLTDADDAAAADPRPSFTSSEPEGPERPSR